MRIIDISQELFSSRVYPGDIAPEFKRVVSMEDGAVYNLTNMELCVHNGTHIDAPRHFYLEGKTIDQIDLNRCIGACTVAELSGEITAKQIAPVLQHCQKRLLIRGHIQLTLQAAKLMNEYGILLFGTEELTVGPLLAPMELHLELLGNEVVILEGLNLSEAEPGEYMLYAAPLNLAGSDGAPCRAILIKE